MAKLGEELKRLRNLMGWSLRDVEEKTGRKVSNSYLYQLEQGTVQEPSPNILYELASVYDVSYASLMQLAGFGVPRPREKGARVENSVAFNALNLTEDEEKEVLDFVEFIRRKKKTKGGRR